LYQYEYDTSIPLLSPLPAIALDNLKHLLFPRSNMSFEDVQDIESKFSEQLLEQSAEEVLSSLMQHPRDLRPHVVLRKLHVACDNWSHEVASCLIDEFGADVNGSYRMSFQDEDEPMRSPLYRVCDPSDNFDEPENSGG
jgi:hypothetical protein